MNKRSIFVLTVLVATIALIAFMWVQLSQIRIKSDKEQNTLNQVENLAANTSKAELENSQAGDDKPDITQKDEPVRSEEIIVMNNSPEYELKAGLTQQNTGECFLGFEYFYEGETAIRVLGKESIPELEDIFEKREASKESTTAFRVNTIYLNPKSLKAYFLVTGNSVGQEVETALYCFNMADGSVKNLFKGLGKFSDLMLQKNMKYLAFSYCDSPLSSVYQGKSLLQVLDCTNDTFAVDASRSSKGGIIGEYTDEKLIYDFYIIGWHSNNLLKLNMATYLKDGTGETAKREVLYNIEKNQITNLDGSSIIPEKRESGQNANVNGKQISETSVENKTESVALKTLESFYEYLSTEQYSKAYDLLDDKFSFNAFKLMGAEKIGKKDIDVDSFSIYGSLLKSARLESVALEDTNNGISRIYFYQVITLSEGNEARQGLVAQLENTGNGWKIISLDDGNTNEAPFLQTVSNTIF